MEKFVCTACGTSFPESDRTPDRCPICLDDRQFVPRGGQRWTTAKQIDGSHKAVFAEEGGFLGIGMHPYFAIGQRALLVRTSAGNVLWDCIPFLNAALIELVDALGGLVAIAISHPHYYGRAEDWSAAFGDVPIHLHEADRAFALNPGPNARFWAGERHEILPGLTLIRCGGHFAGGTVLHVKGGSRKESGAGALLTGDILQVTPGGTGVSFMRSYPNMIPLSQSAVFRIEAALDGLEFSSVVGAFWDRVILSEGREAVDASFRRYIEALNADAD